MVVNSNLPEIVNISEIMKRQCEKVILGVPDELMFARFFGDALYNSEEIKSLLLLHTKADEILILDDCNSYTDVYNKIHFDAVFYGSRFGIAFDAFSVFAIKKEITLIPLMPNKYSEPVAFDALKIALQNLHKNQKIILFGTGRYFDYYMGCYGKRFRPAYAVDNSVERQGTKKANIEIFSPGKIKEENQDNILVIVCAKDYQDILIQLANYGKVDYRLMVYTNAISMIEEYSLFRAGELAYIQKAHCILADMLKEFDRVCQKYQLRYYMICGSLIGVLRHQGFIPWDDDVDVAMPRKDYEKLRKIAIQEWEGTPYRVLGIKEYGRGAFLDCMPRMVNMQERLDMKVYDKVRERAYEDIVNRPFLDIYVMDNAFDNDKLHMVTMNMMKGIYNLMMGHRGYVNYDEYKIAISDKTIHLMKALHIIGRYIPLSILFWMYDHLSRSANRKVTECCFMPSCAIRCIERKLNWLFFQDCVRKPFLDFEVNVPSDCDGIMEAMGYHGYMYFPRMSIRKPSHYYNSDIIIW